LSVPLRHRAVRPVHHLVLEDDHRAVVSAGRRARKLFPLLIGSTTIQPTPSSFSRRTEVSRALDTVGAVLTGAPMYLTAFGLAEAPFSTTPDQRFLYLSDRHRMGVAHLLYGVTERGGFVQ